MQHAISLGLPQRNDLPWQRVHPSITKFVAAALIVLALIGTMLASNWWSNHGSEGLGGAPSIMAPSTPQVKTDEDLVVEFTLPASVIPVGEEVAGGAGTYFIPPGTSSEWGPDCETCTAFLIDLVVTGTLEIQPAAAVQVIRANGTVEEHPANANIVLTQGDAILTRIEIGAQVTNIGTETVELYSWILIGPGTDFGGRTLSGWSEGNFDIHQIPYLVPADTVVRIRRGTVDDGAEIEFAANGQTFIAAIGEGTKQTRPGEGTQKIYGEVGKPVPVYILTIEQPGVATPVPSTPTPTP